MPRIGTLACSVVVFALGCPSRAPSRSAGDGGRAVVARGVDGAASDGASLREAAADVAPAPPPSSPTPTVSMAGGDCVLGDPQVLGPLDGGVRNVAAHVDGDGGIVAWLARRGEMGLRLVDGEGTPRGEPRTVEVEGALDLVAVRRAGEGFVVLGYGGGALLARSLDSEGSPVGEPRRARLPPCHGSVDGGIMGPRPMRLDPRPRVGFDVHPAADGLHLVCPAYQGVVLRHVGLTADALHVGDRYFADIGNVKEAMFLGYFVIGSPERFALVASHWDEDTDPETDPIPHRGWLHPPGPYPPEGSVRGQGRMVLLDRVPRPVRSVALVADEVELITGQDGGPFTLRRRELDGDRVGEDEAIDPAALPAPFDEHLAVAFGVEGESLRLLRRDALGRDLGAAVDVGALATDGSRHARHFPPAAWAWGGRHFIVFWAASHDGAIQVRSRRVSCPRQSGSEQ